MAAKYEGDNLGKVANYLQLELEFKQPGIGFIFRFFSTD
ncbi:hypothetical protein M595_0438 [Lyngbya aestuarii BL J]|uniref:Uncharacterized protein n=1 Tax=Lyngbya aestuarii BL J TaxID=1348334 RepID=U7Q7A9_9CYAN|nr:hypothetical protein M595_6352 [Lyngbya aestuarii BL J]ERT03899.1 hypothetical protein M595_6160 [Lyngbya aestuarii BL J]ERT09579.1 hypothetical protein M595_0438 [Lyngbya aestuarii BL J]